MKNILVCGASGFMGQNIANRFLKMPNYRVYGVGKNRIPANSSDYEIFFNVDLTTQDGIDCIFKSEIQFDIMIQAAANTSGSKDIVSRPHIHVTDNAIINSLLLRACYDYNVGHFLFLSCGVMYDPKKSPVSEEDFVPGDKIPPAYFGIGWTKVYVEKMCEFYAGLGRTKHMSIRHSNTYGPYDKYDLERSHMFGATVTKVMNAKDNDNIVVWGDGKTERDLLYIDDVIDFIELAIKYQKNNYELVNVGYGSSFSVSDIVKKIIKHSGKKLHIIHDINKPSINTRLSLSCRRAYKLYGWKPRVLIDEGIKRTIIWYSCYKEGVPTND